MQQVVAQIPWGHNITLLTKVKVSAEREWYAHAAIENGWSRSVLVHQIESKLYQRQGKAVTNFAGHLQSDNPSIGLILCKDKNRLVAEYALKDTAKPMGISEYRLIESVPADLQGSLPSIEQIESELTKV